MYQDNLEYECFLAVPSEYSKNDNVINKKVIASSESSITIFSILERYLLSHHILNKIESVMMNLMLKVRP